MSIARHSSKWEQLRRYRRSGLGFGEHLRVRNLTDTLAGLSAAALADEILLEGPRQVRALISVGGNPVGAWINEDRLDFDSRTGAPSGVDDADLSGHAPRV